MMVMARKSKARPTKGAINAIRFSLRKWIHDRMIVVHKKKIQNVDIVKLVIAKRGIEYEHNDSFTPIPRDISSK